MRYAKHRAEREAHDDEARERDTIKLGHQIFSILFVAMFISLAFVVSLALISGLEFPGAKKHASMWKLDETLTISSESSLTMRIALNPRNAAELTDKVHSIADPQSANFRKYLDNRQITDLVGVSQPDMDRVLAWARESNFEVVEVPQNRDWITVRATAGAIEKGLKTKLASWTSDINGQVTRCILQSSLLKLSRIPSIRYYRERLVLWSLTPSLTTSLTSFR